VKDRRGDGGEFFGVRCTESKGKKKNSKYRAYIKITLHGKKGKKDKPFEQPQRRGVTFAT